jgi:hypothetical protein
MRSSGRLLSLGLLLALAACGGSSDADPQDTSPLDAAGGDGGVSAQGGSSGHGNQAGSTTGGASGSGNHAGSGQSGQAGSPTAGSAGQGAAGSGQAGNAGSSDAGSGQAGSAQAGNAGSGQAGSGNAGSGQGGATAGGASGGSDPAGGNAGSGDAGSGQAGSGNAGSGGAGSGNAGGNAGSGDAGSGQGGSGGMPGPTLSPFDCGGAATPVVFVGEEVPPATLAPAAVVAVSVTFANCGTGTLHGASASDPTGVKLGSQAPQDSTTWGTNRYSIGLDIPVGSAVTIPFSIQAPALAGPYGYQWKLLDEGVAWLEGPSPAHTITVAAAPQEVTLCAGVTADAGGVAPASAAIQTCIDQTPAGGTLELPPGNYRMTSAIHLDKPFTLRTLGVDAGAPSCLGGPACATLVADENLLTDRGFVRIGTTSAVTVDHLVLDGNRGARLGSAAAAQCVAGNNGAGFNASTADCTGCALRGVASVRALCGTGMEWRGDSATFSGNTFGDNGSHQDQNLWSDGLTILHSDGVVVDGNLFHDNSDVDLILGGARNATIANNTIAQAKQAAFAGLMLDNFNGATPGDFTGAVVTGNTIDCGALLCDFGLELGPHAWYPSPNILGGTVMMNVISGGKFNINAQGAGTQAAPTVVYGNALGPSPASATFLCGERPCTAFDVSPDSVVDTSQGSPPTGTFPHTACP